MSMGNRSSEHKDRSPVPDGALEREQEKVKRRDERISHLEREKERLQKELDEMKSRTSSAHVAELGARVKTQEERLQQAEQAIRVSMKGLAEAHCALTGEASSGPNSSLWSWFTSLFGKDANRGHQSRGIGNTHAIDDESGKQDPSSSQSVASSSASQSTWQAPSRGAAVDHTEDTSRPAEGKISAHSSSRTSSHTFGAQSSTTFSPIVFHVRIIWQNANRDLGLKLGEKLQEVFKPLLAPSSRLLCLEIVFGTGEGDAFAAQSTSTFGDTTALDGDVRRIELFAFQFGAGFVTEVIRILKPIQDGKNVLVLHSNGHEESKQHLDQSIRQFFNDKIERHSYKTHPDDNDPIFRNTFSATFTWSTDGYTIRYASAEELSKLLSERLLSS